MTPSPAALAVLLDAARACYGDDSEQVRWLLNPDAVRELMKIAPTFTPEHDHEQCSCCTAAVHHAHDKHCRIAAAWRALGDPRGAADIERAHEEAIRHATVRSRNPEVTAALSPYRLASESQQAAQARYVANPFPHPRPCVCVHCAISERRSVSDARGMEAVEEEAIASNRAGCQHRNRRVTRAPLPSLHHRQPLAPVARQDMHCGDCGASL